MENIEKFIEFVNDLTTEIYFKDYFIDGKYLFTHGGCHIFTKIVSNFYDVNIIIKKDNNHCGFEYNGVYYDANGKIEDYQNYKLATHEDIEYMEYCFGGHIINLNIYETIINELEEIENIPFLPKKYQKKSF